MKHWKNLGKRGLALFLVLMMCMTMLPTAAFAVEEETIPCEACEGRGMVESACPDCGGTGKVSVTSACPDCEEPAECPACNGTGEVTEEVTADCDACGGTGEAECPTCGGTRQVATETDCANCGGTGEVERICAECGGSGRVAKSQEDPVDTEAIAAAVGGVAEELQDLGDRFGAFQEEFFWNLTGDEEDPMADFTAAAVVEFGEEFNALLAKYKAIPAEVTETEYAGTYAEMEYALQMMADAMGGDLNSGVETLAYDAPRTIYLYIDPNGGSVGRVVKTASVFDGKSFSSIVQTYFPSYYKPTNQYKQRSNSYGSWTSRSTSESTSYQDVLIANWHEHSYNWTSISDTQHQLVCSCGQTSGNPQSHNRSILSQSAATCDSYASTTYYCSTCGHTWTEYGSSYATHTWGNWYNNGNGKEHL